MKAISVEEGKKLQLDILLAVDAFCEQHGLRYFLCGGTLIGAVRHQGFIPWDDDIDISMPRPDYERFLKSFQHPDYRLYHYREGGKELLPFAKVYDRRTLLEENMKREEDIGINIDVFPVDGLPDDDQKIKKLLARMRWLRGWYVAATLKDASHRSLARRLQLGAMRAVYKICPIQHRLCGKLVKEAQQYPFDTSDRVAVLVWGYWEREVVPRSSANRLTRAPFEGHMLSIPVEYDVYLRSLYGDYMQLPPEEKRVYKHHAKMYWLDEQE